MAPVNLKSLVGRLNDNARRALEGAAGLCLSRTHYNVEIEHWLLKLLDDSGGDVAAILRAFEIDPARVTLELERSLERLKTGNGRPPALAPNVVDLAREAWLVASIEFGAAQARGGHVLLALVADDDLARQAQAASNELASISVEALRTQLEQITADTSETANAAAATSTEGATRPAGGKTPHLDQYTIDLTETARAGKIDPVLGRDGEIRQVIDILTRRRQNNPILTGEAGVGKTAVAEGFALRVADGDVPESLKGVAVKTLDLSLLQAGAGVKGEFENRLKGVIQEVKGSATPIVLFIDEAHTMIGAGGQAGQGDAANLLKPALARGELRTIAATTWAEYKKYFEKDAALARRFQVVKVEEPDEAIGIQIMRGVAGTMESHHGVRVLDEAIVDSVRLSSRYIAGRQLPDKSVSLLDTACARVALSRASTPPQVEGCRRRIERAETELGILRREVVTDEAHAERIGELEELQAELGGELESLEARWNQELEMVEEMREVRAALEAVAAPESTDEETLTPAERDAKKGRLDELSTRLADLQGEEPLVQPCVDSHAIAEIVSSWTGIPVGRMVADQIQTVLNLKDRLEERVVGQSHALDAIAQSIRTSRANLTDPNKPVGVFMLAGTSGVGKTETAIALAELLYGGEQNMTVINMSEFKEEHKVSLLLGSPPGYVGYGEGGVLTEAVRRRPYSVVLLDELEKAHPGVQEIFYQVFDKGTIKDGEGRDIDFRNTVVIMTTNAGTDTITSLWADPETMPEGAALKEAVMPELLQTFKPAFLGRTAILPYLPLSDDVMRGIVRLKLGKIGKRVERNYGVDFDFTEGLVDAIVDRCTEVETGARNVDHILDRSLLPELAAEFLARMGEERPVRSVSIDAGADGAFATTFQ